MGKDKRLCKWSEDKIKKDFSDYCGAIGSAGHVCMKCGRAAEAKDLLCKPERRKTATV